MRRLMCRGDYPEWLGAEFERAFGARAGEEGAALARRAPVDLRVNTLKADRDKVLKALRRFEAGRRRTRPSAFASSRRRAPAAARMSRPSLATARAGTRCRTRARKLAALLSGAEPRQQVIDLCAGLGGKTLALAALMENTGQLYAYDSDRLRLTAHLRAAEAGRGEERPGAAGRRP